jgi:hypothetical protein
MRLHRIYRELRFPLYVLIASWQWIMPLSSAADVPTTQRAGKPTVVSMDALMPAQEPDLSAGQTQGSRLLPNLTQWFINTIRLIAHLVSIIGTLGSRITVTKTGGCKQLSLVHSVPRSSRDANYDIHSTNFVPIRYV